MHQQTENTSLGSKVANWWNDNPFVYSFEKKDFVPDKVFFREIDRKFIKWTPWAQNDSTPLSGVIDFESLSGKRVLDIAIGTGWSSEQFARFGAKVSGIDISPSAIELSKKRFELFDLPRAQLVVADAQKLPFEDNTFDFVLAWGCLMHMPDTQQAINEINRVLKPGGKMKAMMYNKHSLHWWYYIWLSKGILRGKLLGMSNQELSNRYTDGVYQGGNKLTKFFSSNEVKDMFRGFNECKISINDTTTPIDHFPHRKIPLGSFLPEKTRKHLATIIGQSLWIESTK
mgnify:CR=1 FL=1|jgi:ubiquinone/menaquinone biosynthesis C-methylase UbiE